MRPWSIAWIKTLGGFCKTLDDLKITDNTVVLFLSDNGSCAETPGGNDTEHRPGPKEFYSHVGPNWAYAQNSPFRRYKSHTHEGGIATPLVVRWPAKVEAGAITDQVGHIIDFMPTFLDMAGAKYPVTHKEEALLREEGVSLVEALKGNKVKRPAPLFWFWSKNRGVREGNWKLVWEQKSKQGWELYDLSKDRTETNNLAESNPAKVQQLSKKWIAWAAFTDVKY